MLTLNVLIEPERYDERIGEFIPEKSMSIQLEHSLVSLQKWESKWKKAFLSKENQTHEETIDYIKCMTLTENVPPEVYENLGAKHYDEISKYIDSPMTATTIAKPNTKTINGEKITAELIYYWMIALNIPFEYRTWHLNQLITLVEVCNVKNTPPKKMNKKEIMQRNKELNEKRRKEYNTKG